MNKNLYLQFDPVFLEKTRLTIMTLLYKEQKVSFNLLKDLTESTDGGLYSHMQKLIQAGYVQGEKIILENKPSTNYRLTLKGRETYISYLHFLRNEISND